MWLTGPRKTPRGLWLPRRGKVGGPIPPRRGRRSRSTGGGALARLFGSRVSGLYAYTAAVDLVVGFVGPYLVDTALANDSVSSDATYKIG